MNMSTNLGAWWMWLLLFLLYIKPISVIWRREYQLKSISLIQYFDTALFIWQNIISLVRVTIFSLASYWMRYRRELWITSFYLIFWHGMLARVSWFKSSINLWDALYQIYIIFGLLWLFMLFIWWITSNAISVKLLQRYWKKIQYVSYASLVFGAIHLTLIGWYQYTVITFVFFVLKWYEWYPKTTT